MFVSARLRGLSGTVQLTHKVRAGKFKTNKPEPICNEVLVKIKIALLVLLLAFAVKPRAASAQAV